ncbi:EAL domain-containing protein [Pseudoduganella lutea]|uniref:cyclic-guanylate-specific phosphodiesterase n=1 Tax=Pseudoduganella lutea TaxID=321985 RepID=A0A4P6L511_9BURK|nr:EAL domain-containing protein [Pseudoduganella lutea]QBE65922.1 EAL domain-containing protein [Pseudoduganella lutea]
MKKVLVIALTAVAVTAAIVAPVSLAIHEAGRQGFHGEAAQALWYARDVLHRTSKTAQQVEEGIGALVLAHGAAPCTPQSIDQMREIDLRSSYVQAIGHVAGDAFECSSVSNYDEGFNIGPAELETAGGLKVRRNVTFPIAPGHEYLVLELKGFAAVLHKDLPIDTSMTQRGVVLAVSLLAPRMVLVSHGGVHTRWLDQLGRQGEATFVDGGYTVAVVRSRRFNTAALAAIPASYQAARSREIAWRLVPAGAGMGLVLAFVIVMLARRQLALPAAIRAGLRRHQFHVAYQPIVDLGTGKWVGAEALVRWRRPGGPVISPDEFIPAAEQSGLIVRITDRVLELVMNEAGAFLASHPHFHIGVNLSSADFHTGDLIERLQAATGRASLPPGSLMAEVTERGLLDKDVAGPILSALRGQGFPIAIDDFGTGYSSLSYLESLPLNYLKIDRSFTEAIGTGAATSQVVPHIIRMATDLGLQMIAEGVENSVQRDFLLERGVQFAQGWLFGKPMPFPEFVAMMDEQAAAVRAAPTPS